MTTPLVSVIVPSYNQSAYLPVALDSVFFQDYPNIEIIICNHGSTDDTAKVVQCFLRQVVLESSDYLERMEEGKNGPVYIRKSAPRYSSGRRVKVFESEENIGATRSYNIGFQNASGRYCLYLVGDDYLLPGAISEMVAAIEKQDVDCVYADMHLVDDSGRILQRLTKPDYDPLRCFVDWFHLGVCRLYKRSLHKTSGFYDPQYTHANDYDLFLRFAMDGATFYHLSKVMYCVRKHFQTGRQESGAWRGEGGQILLEQSTRCARRARRFFSVSK